MGLVETQLLDGCGLGPAWRPTVPVPAGCRRQSGAARHPLRGSYWEQGAHSSPGQEVGWVEARAEDESCVLPGRNWRIQGEDAAAGDTATLSLLGFLSVSARLAEFYHLCL